MGWWVKSLRVLKLVTALVTAVGTPVGFYIGYLFGVERYLVGGIAMGIWTVVTFLDFYLYLWVLKATVSERR